MLARGRKPQGEFSNFMDRSVRININLKKDGHG